MILIADVIKVHGHKYVNLINLKLLMYKYIEIAAPIYHPAYKEIIRAVEELEENYDKKS